jgi:hypothetical protein
MRRWMLAVCIPPCLASPALAQTAEPLTGAAALSDWKSDAPGVRRLIRLSDLPAPPTGTDPEKSVAQPAKVGQGLLVMGLSTRGIPRARPCPE